MPELKLDKVHKEMIYLEMLPAKKLSSKSLSFVGPRITVGEVDAGLTPKSRSTVSHVSIKGSLSPRHSVTEYRPARPDSPGIKKSYNMLLE